MKNPQKRLEAAAGVNQKVATLFRKRFEGARERYQDRLREAFGEHVVPVVGAPGQAAGLAGSWPDYMTDVVQRSVLFWDTLRQRGNQFIAHQRAGLPPLLHFDYETVVDARSFERPVNYALLRIIPPKGVTVDPRRRPYMIIDPRAGHGPGIGGFKDDSEVGVALREGHPVYFVVFFPQPEPGQTLLDVCAAESVFVKKVRALHPDSPKPAIVGNCQGGWAAMMLASSDPEDTGPIVINGAPMSYWGGAWEEGDNDNPMRYAGGLLGGTWLSSFVSDLSDGIFDGAWLVQNFENQNPANTFWNKYYHVFANVDTEPPRFLEFERWWGGFYLMNREEIEWITENLFVGNKLWSGGLKARSGRHFDLREIRSPIILFASMGDNITPPEQAFNWVADVYGSTEEIKARGQVIVGLLHKDVGHLGIFVSGAVANKEHAQIVSVMKSIEALPPGLYGMNIITVDSRDGQQSYQVEFVERRLEDVVGRLNKFKRVDEKPFESVAEVSEFNQRAYELFAQPFVQLMSNEYTAKLARDFHPLRFQRWAISDLNPWFGWLAPAAGLVHGQRKALGAEHPWRQLETMGSEFINASLDFYRDVNNALSEAMFFNSYGNLFVLRHAGTDGMRVEEPVVEARELPVVQEALAQIGRGGFAEAAARIGFLMQRNGEPMPLSRLEMRADMARDYRDLLPQKTPDELRRIRGVQEIIVRFEPEKAVATLPGLVRDPAERDKLQRLFDAVLKDPRVQAIDLTPEQAAARQRIRAAFGEVPPTLPARPAKAEKPKASVRPAARAKGKAPAQAKIAAPVVAGPAPEKAVTKAAAAKPAPAGKAKPAQRAVTGAAAKPVAAPRAATRKPGAAPSAVSEVVAMLKAAARQKTAGPLPAARSAGKPAPASRPATKK
jgi:pimeloyl-ACP methyl ester carboxylesterase